MIYSTHNIHVFLFVENGTQSLSLTRNSTMQMSNFHFKINKFAYFSCELNLSTISSIELSFFSIIFSPQRTEISLWVTNFLIRLFHVTAWQLFDSYSSHCLLFRPERNPNGFFKKDNGKSYNLSISPIKSVFFRRMLFFFE